MENLKNEFLSFAPTNPKNNSKDMYHYTQFHNLLAYEIGTLNFIIY